MAVTTMRSSTSEHSHQSPPELRPLRTVSPLQPVYAMPLPLSSTGYPSGNPHTRTETEFHKRFSSSFVLGTAAGAHLWPFAICQWRGLQWRLEGKDLGEVW